MKLGETLSTLRNMVDSFVSEHSITWEKFYNKFEEENGFSRGRKFITMQSYIGSDLLIDFCSLARDVEEGAPFEREYWIRTQGTQCIKDPNNEEEKHNNRVFKDIIAKIHVKFDGVEFEKPTWFQDEDCLIDNKFIKENKDYYRYI